MFLSYEYTRSLLQTTPRNHHKKTDCNFTVCSRMMALRRRWCVEMAVILPVLLALTQDTSCKDFAFDVYGKSGSITSPNFPNSYPKNTACTWNITADVGHILNITFILIDIETSHDCFKDYIQIRLGRNNSSTTQTRYCNSVPRTLLSEDGWAQIMFVSDDNGENSGFNLTWVTTKARQGNPSISPLHVTKRPSCTDNGKDNVYLIHETVIQSSCPSEIPQGSIPSTIAVYKENSNNCDCSSWQSVSQNSTRLYLSSRLASNVEPSSFQTILNPIASSGPELFTRSLTTRTLETISQTSAKIAVVTSWTKSLQVSLEMSLTSQNIPSTIVDSSVVPPKTTINLVCPNEDSEMVLSSLAVPLLALGSFFIGAAIIFGILLCRSKRENRVNVMKK